MAFLDLMKQLFQHSVESDEQPARIAELRARLADDPNDVVAFDELVRIAQSAEEEQPPADPLRADTTATGSVPVSADLAIWALAEELSGNTSSWYPQIQLARLSVKSDTQGAIKKLNVAADRNPSGEVLAKCVKILRDAGMPDQALSLGLAHWAPGKQDAVAGWAIIDAALDAERVQEAKTYMRELEPYVSRSEIEEMMESINRVSASVTGVSDTSESGNA